MQHRSYYNRENDSCTGSDETPVYNDNLVVRPKCIRYALNDQKSRGIVNTINFEYMSLGNNARPISVAGKTGIMDVCLASITTKTDNVVHRKYSFSYNHEGDQSIGRWSRLSSVLEENGLGEKLPPISFEWAYLPSKNISASQLLVTTDNSDRFTTETDKAFFATDLNGDGISDMIRISPVSVIGLGDNKCHYCTYVYIAKSTIDRNGRISWANYPIKHMVDASFSMGQIQSKLNGTPVLDFDGDGYNDLVITHNSTSYGEGWEYFRIIYGSDVANETCGAYRSPSNNDFPPIPQSYSFRMQTSNSDPLFAYYDTNGDGKDDIICLEKEQKNGYYPGFIMMFKDRVEGTIQDTVRFSVSLSKAPQRLFSGDFNNDGLNDLFILHDGGYKIYYNNNGAGFTERNSKNVSGNDKQKHDVLKDHYHVEQGDFNGDGLCDFVYNVGSESSLYIANNLGNGLFSILGPIQTDIKSDKDNYSINVVDIDHDGYSDVMISKTGQKTQWLLSNGETLSLANTVNNGQTPSYIFVGDFNGDGYAELANYRSSLLGTDNSFEEGKINVYSTSSDLSQVGKITSITDGFGSQSDILYAFATNPYVYKRTTNYSYPVNNYTLPISVVSDITYGNGVCGNHTVNYTYKDLKIHVKGRGMLGFNCISSNDTTMGTEQSTEITEWDETLWLPKKVKSITCIGNEHSVTESEYTTASIGNNFFAYISYNDVTDLDGNKTTMLTQYIDSIGVIKEQVVYNDCDKMYKKMSYEDYDNKGGIYLPAKIIMEQKHINHSTPYSSTTSYVYDELGQIISQTVNDGTDMALTTEYTYDSWGNVASTKSLVAGDKEIVSYNVYDSSGRFVTKNYTTPASIVNTFTYDIWGNVLTETDETNSSFPLTIRQRYDGWGREIEAIDAEGIKSQYSINWGSSTDKKYCVVEETDNAPRVTTWYDKSGRKVEQSSLGQKGIIITQSWTYNNQGQVSQKVEDTGTLHLVNNYSYNDRGHVINESSNTGKSVSYDYGNRSITTIIGNRRYTQMSDAWGNPIKSIDPDETTVSYTYHSNGHPRNIKSDNTTIALSYDAAGNKKSLNDHDAGRMTYTYAPDGMLISQIDGRGIETINTYDELGRVVESKTGDKTIYYEYGTSGNSVMRLTKQRLGSNSIEYLYDSLGRVTTEIRTISNHGALEFNYNYNDKNQLSKIVYPGGLTVGYRYDENGFKTQILANGQVVSELISYDGKVSRTSFMNSLTTTCTRNDKGFVFNTSISSHANILEQFLTDYDVMTNNLLSRKRTDNPIEGFSYDNQDRLTQVMRGNEVVMSMDYATNGNITSKSDVGNYIYGSSTNKPHAVKSISNQPQPLPSSLLGTMYNVWGKIDTISLNRYNGTPLIMDVVYGPDQERWYSELSTKNGIIRETVYAGNYEKVTENGIIREYYYLDDNVIVVKQNGVFTPYLSFKDNLGSFLSIWDAEGEKVFDADYDAWGKQEVHLNDIGFQRGYTGHEMWNEFGIINMNGRLYDPTIARFLSPDNYVQAPDNSQSFNRYSYCLNNPLKYTDPSGEFWEWVIAGAILGAIQSGAMAEMNEGKSFWSGAWKGAIVGGLGAAAGMYAGSAMASCVGTSGFWAGAAVGACSGGTSALINGAGTTWINGASFASCLRNGALSSVFGAAMGSVTCGLTGYSNSLSNKVGAASIEDIPIDPNAIYLKNVNVTAYNTVSYKIAGINIWNQIYGFEAISAISTMNLWGGFGATLLGSRGDYSKNLWGESWRGKNGKWYSSKDLIKVNGKKAPGYNFLRNSLELAKTRVPRSAVVFSKVAKISGKASMAYDGLNFYNNPSWWGVYDLVADGIGYIGGVPGASYGLYINSVGNAAKNVMSGNGSFLDWLVLKGGCSPSGMYSTSVFYGIPQ